MVKVNITLSLEDVICLVSALEQAPVASPGLAQRLLQSARSAIKRSEKAQQTTESSGPATAAT